MIIAAEPSAISANDAGSGIAVIWPRISPLPCAVVCTLTYQFSAMSSVA